jgi:exodeoxyribonuclease V alpha subunit
VNAHRVNRGQLPELAPPEELSDFYFVESPEAEEAVEKIIEVVRNRIPSRFGLDPTRDIQVLCPMNRGSAGARALNERLQLALNPAAAEVNSVERFGYVYRTKDKVMQIQNNYEKDVFNGDIGFVATVDIDASELTIDFDGRMVVYQFGELDEVVLAYATSIHKSQGSEYPAVVVPMVTQHYAMLERNLLYTAITRGKRLVVIIGQKKAVAIAVHGTKDRRRWSKLRENLECGNEVM